MLDILTFTGVDAKTDMAHLVDISARYPKVEFGVLVGSGTSKWLDRGIFPSLKIVSDLTKLNIPMAIHLCGRYSRSVMHSMSDRILDLCEGFNRVQVNLHGDEFSPYYIQVSDEVKQFAARVSCKSVIIQHRDDWIKVPIINKRIEYLFDRSGGAGREAFGEWPEPSLNLPRMGYSGGIGLRNINRAMKFVNTRPELRFWLDMEGNVRVDGLFDLGTVEAICEKVFDTK